MDGYLSQWSLLLTEAAKPTWVMKYPTSFGSNAINLCTSYIEAWPVYGSNPGIPCWEQPSNEPKNWYRWVRRKLQGPWLAKSPKISKRVVFPTHYCDELSVFEGLLFFSGSAPPSSRKLTDTPWSPPRLLEARSPVKYGSRLTSVPLYWPGAKIPATLIPTLGCVSGEER